MELSLSERAGILNKIPFCENCSTMYSIDRMRGAGQPLDVAAFSGCTSTSMENKVFFHCRKAIVGGDRIWLKKI